MYIKSLTIKNLRCIEKAELDFVYPTDDEAPDGLALRHPNINLILGDNGTGKSSILKAVSIACLSPVLEASGFRPYHLVRRVADGTILRTEVKADLLLHIQDEEMQITGIEDLRRLTTNLTDNGIFKDKHKSSATITRIEDQENIDVKATKNLRRLLSQDDSPAFFIMAYSASRRAEATEVVDESARNKLRSLRYQRMASLFEEHFSLMPLTSLSAKVVDTATIKRAIEVSEFINNLIPDDTHFEFAFLRELRNPLISSTEEEINEIRSMLALEGASFDQVIDKIIEIAHGFSTFKHLNQRLSKALNENSIPEDQRKEWQEFLGQFDGFPETSRSTRTHFTLRGLPIPFSALSDGYRAFLSWLCDFLYHFCKVCPINTSLRDLRGIVMVDEIDLHLHPTWQREVIEKLSTTFPRIQWILTSHSPLVAGTLEPENIIVMESMDDGTIVPRRYQESTYGRSADQMLTSPYFGLLTTRAPGAEDTLEDLARRAAEGDSEASLKYLQLLAHGAPRLEEAERNN